MSEKEGGLALGEAKMMPVGRMSQQEIAQAINALSDAGWVRLKKVARRYARPSISAEDLLQEAFARALAGDRTCPVDVDVVRFLAEAMRSIADGEQEKLRAKLVALDGAALPTSEHMETEIASAEQCEVILEQALSLFEDDPIAQEILEGDTAGFTVEELRELTGLDQTAHNSKRRLIRRRIDKRFPEGWKL